MTTHLFKACLLVIMADLALSGLVARIDEPFQLEPQGDTKYVLRLSDEFQRYQRKETVNETPVESGVLQVSGELEQQYIAPPGKLFVTYEAGPSGYIAKYSWSQTNIVPPVVSLPAGTLKSLAG